MLLLTIFIKSFPDNIYKKIDSEILRKENYLLFIRNIYAENTNSESNKKEIVWYKELIQEPRDNLKCILEKELPYYSTPQVIQEDNNKSLINKKQEK